MTTIPQSKDTIDWEVDKNKLPKNLNTLTILTFIGCGVQSISLVWNVLKKPLSETDLQDMQDKYDKAPEFLRSIMGSHGVELARKSTENNFSISILTLICVCLCLYGAIRMRAMKIEGFYIYVVGELILPLLTSIIFVGIGLYGSLTLVLFISIPILFIILYASQWKHLS